MGRKTNPKKHKAMVHPQRREVKELLK